MRLRPVPGCLLVLIATSFLVGQGSLVQAAEKPSVDELASQLAEGNTDVRRKAARQLSQLGPEAAAALPSLIDALDDPDKQVWFGAVTAISRIGPEAEAAIPELIEDLDRKDQDGWRRRYGEQLWYRAAFALGQIGRAAISPLVEALNHETPSVRAGAAKALGWMKEKAKGEIGSLMGRLDDPDGEVRHQVAQALGEIGKPTVPYLIRTLASSKENSRVQASAALALGWVGTEAKTSGAVLMRTWKQSEDPNVISEIIQALSRIQYDGQQIVGPLVEALGASSEKVRHAAVNGLLKLEPEVTLSPLIESLNQGDQTAKERSAYVLGRIGKPAADAIPSLIALRENVDQPSNGDSYENALIQIGSPSVMPLIRALLGKDEGGLESGHWIVRCLAEIGGPAVPDLADALASDFIGIRFGAIKALTRIGDEAGSATAAIRNALNDPEPQMRAAALKAMNAVGAPREELLGAIRDALGDEAALARKSAAEVAGSLGTEGAPLAGPLTDSIGDGDHAVRLAVIDALGRIGVGEKETISGLVSAMSDSLTLQNKAIESLGRIGNESGSAVSEIVGLVRDQQRTTTKLAYRAIARIGGEGESTLALVKEGLSHGDPDVRAAAVVAFSEIADDPNALLPSLTDALKDEASVVRHRAAEAVGSLGKAGREATPELFALLNNEDDRGVALDALRQVRANSVSHLVDALSHDVPSVRLFACESLGRLAGNATEALSALEKATDDEYAFVRREAKKAIDRIKDGQ